MMTMTVKSVAQFFAPLTPKHNIRQEKDEAIITEYYNHSRELERGSSLNWINLAEHPC